MANFVGLLNELRTTYSELKKALEQLLEAGERRDAARIAALTPELLRARERAGTLDQRLTALSGQAAAERGIELAAFKLSLLDPSGRHLGRLEELRSLVGETARLAARAGGVLAANVAVIEETVRVLESIDASNVGYGADRPVARPAKMIDRTA